MPAASGTARRRLSFNGHTPQAASGMFHAARKTARRIRSSKAGLRAARSVGLSLSGRRLWHTSANGGLSSHNKSLSSRFCLLKLARQS